MSIALSEGNLNCFYDEQAGNHVSSQCPMQKEPEEQPVKATIQPLKKVTLSLMTGGSAGKCSRPDTAADLEFIYGVASDGLCPFESALADKCRGDTLALSIPVARAHEFFGHIFQPLCQALGLRTQPETISLNIEITAVSDADNREVVQSLAKSLAHGSCGGSCGCGC